MLFIHVYLYRKFFLLSLLESLLDKMPATGLWIFRGERVSCPSFLILCHGRCSTPSAYYGNSYLRCSGHEIQHQSGWAFGFPLKLFFYSYCWNYYYHYLLSYSSHASALYLSLTFNLFTVANHRDLSKHCSHRKNIYGPWCNISC